MSPCVYLLLFGYPNHEPSRPPGAPIRTHALTRAQVERTLINTANHIRKQGTGGSVSSVRGLHTAWRDHTEKGVRGLGWSIGLEAIRERWVFRQRQCHPLFLSLSFSCSLSLSLCRFFESSIKGLLKTVCRRRLPSTLDTLQRQWSRK